MEMIQWRNTDNLFSHKDGRMFPNYQYRFSLPYLQIFTTEKSQAGQILLGIFGQISR